MHYLCICYIIQVTSGREEGTSDDDESLVINTSEVTEHAQIVCYQEMFTMFQIVT